MPRRTPAQLRTRLLALAEQLLAGEGPVVALIARMPAVARAAAGGPVSPTQRAILAALTDLPQPAARLARAAGRAYNSYFRQQLAVLTDAGLARRISSGYLRPGS